MYEFLNADNQFGEIGDNCLKCQQKTPSNKQIFVKRSEHSKPVFSETEGFHSGQFEMMKSPGRAAYKNSNLKLHQI